MTTEENICMISSLLAAQRFIFVQTAEQQWVDKLDLLLQSIKNLLDEFKQQEVIEECNENASDVKGDFSINQLDEEDEYDCDSTNLKLEMKSEEEYDEDPIEIRKKFKDVEITNDAMAVVKKAVEANIVDGRFQCPEENCKGLFKNRASLNVHLHNLHPNTTFVCDECGVAFKTKKRLKYHVERKHNMTKNVCELCSKEFTNTKALQTHVNNVHLNERKPCEHCGKFLSNDHTLSVHIASEHKIGDGKIHKCSKCEKIFIHRALLAQHMVYSHVDVDRFKCDLCDYKTNIKSILKRHQNVHSDVRDVQCDLCESKFKSKQILKSHIDYVHNKIRDHKCDICEKAFQSKWKLDDHVKTHTGQRDFQCQFCEKSFIQKSNRETHVKKVHSQISHF